MSFEVVQSHIIEVNDEINSHIDSANKLEQKLLLLKQKLSDFCEHENVKNSPLNTGSSLDKCLKCGHKYLYSMTLNTGWLPIQVREWKVYDPNK